MAAMSEETLFEKLGVKYIEKDGIFYPLITLGGEEKNIDVGKYGHMWIDYRRSIHSDIGVWCGLANYMIRQQK